MKNNWATQTFKEPFDEDKSKEEKNVLETSIKSNAINEDEIDPDLDKASCIDPDLDKASYKTESKSDNSNSDSNTRRFLHWRERSCCNLVMFGIYRVFKLVYVSFYFYFTPCFVWFGAILIPLTFTPTYQEPTPVVQEPSLLKEMTETLMAKFKGF